MTNVNPLRLSSHGGYCCGIQNLSNFRSSVTLEHIKEKLSITRQNRTQGILVEAVLTNAQCQQSNKPAELLQKAGFKLVSRFRNPNSRNICNVFHYNQAPRDLTRRLPFKIVDKD